MTASSSTSDSLAQPTLYRDAVLALTGDLEPLVILQGLLPALHEGLAAVPPARQGTPEAPGKWSARQVVQHLADTELAFGWRVRQILTADKPVLQGFDENAWMTRLRSGDDDLDGALAQLAALRHDLLRLLKTCTAADLARTGVHSERGEEPLSLLVRLIAGHDLVHRRQLDRIAAAIA